MPQAPRRGCPSEDEVGQEQEDGGSCSAASKKGRRYRQIQQSWLAAKLTVDPCGQHARLWLTGWFSRNIRGSMAASNLGMVSLHLDVVHASEPRSGMRRSFHGLRAHRA